MYNLDICLDELGQVLCIAGGDPVKIRTRHLPNTRLMIYRHTKPFGHTALYRMSADTVMSVVVFSIHEPTNVGQHDLRNGELKTGSSTMTICKNLWPTTPRQQSYTLHTVLVLTLLLSTAQSMSSLHQH
jgi:hypothetical protein